MINRTLIRIKTVQLIYAYYQNGGKDVNVAEKELLFSMGKSYDLYKYLLTLIVEVTNYAKDVVFQREQLNKVAHIDTPISHRFCDNRLAAQLEANKQLSEFRGQLKQTWSDTPDFMKKLYRDICASEQYIAYMNAPEADYAADKELWRSLYKHVVMKDTRIDEILEEQSLYWNDDREIIDTFVVKTIKRLNADSDESFELLPQYKDAEDLTFGTNLFRAVIDQAEECRELISGSIQNWAFDRLAFMDLLIMQTAVAELLNFPLIPASVTINEYVEIAKMYSTHKSGSYVNGIIDNICKKLTHCGRINK